MRQASLPTLAECYASHFHPWFALHRVCSELPTIVVNKARLCYCLPRLERARISREIDPVTTKSAETQSSAPIPGGDTVLVEFEDGIAWVTMNRPEKRNAMSPTLAAEMLQVMNALEIDTRCKVLVLTGAGNSFSAGMDLKEFFRETDQMSPPEREQIIRTNAQWQWRQLMFYPKPTIAMVNGWCFGGAFTPLVSCDLAIAAEEATFGLSEINWGIIPAGVVTKAVAQVMSQRDALYYIMTGETFDGRKAAAMNLVNEAVPLKDLRSAHEGSSPKR